MTVYNCFPHGFLNYHIQILGQLDQGVKEARTCVEDAANYIKELLELG